MDSQKRFDKSSRAERYFVATLLPHLLMAQDFAGLKALFRNVFPNVALPHLTDDFEVVSELDPLRDARFHSANVKAIFAKKGRIAVPDLFLRWDNLFLLVEGKFFTRVREEVLRQQMNKEKQALDLVLTESNYSIHDSKCLILTVDRHPFLSNDSILGMTWHQLVEILEKNVPRTQDTIYSFDVLRNCLETAKSHKPFEWDTYKFTELTGKFAECDENTTFVSYTGGLNSLTNASLEDLQTRRHYKLSTIQRSKNSWVSLREFKARLAELKSR